MNQKDSSYLLSFNYINNCSLLIYLYDVLFTHDYKSESHCIQIT